MPGIFSFQSPHGLSIPFFITSPGCAWSFNVSSSGVQCVGWCKVCVGCWVGLVIVLWCIVCVYLCGSGGLFTCPQLPDHEWRSTQTQNHITHKSSLKAPHTPTHTQPHTPVTCQWGHIIYHLYIFCSLVAPLGFPWHPLFINIVNTISNNPWYFLAPVCWWVQVHQTPQINNKIYF